MRYVAFLRAVNVGGRTIKMDRLRALFEELPLRNVETFIASGNVLFDSTAGAASLEAKIEKHLEKRLRFAVPTLIRSAPEVATVAAHDPFAAEPFGERGGLYVGFLKSAPDAEGIAKVMKLADAVNAFAFVGREVYWRANDRMAVLKITGATFERALRMPATFRNITTVTKLAARLPARIP